MLFPHPLEPVVFIVNSALSSWVEAQVTAAGLRASSLDTRPELLPYLKPDTVACAILDVSLSGGSGLELPGHLVLPCNSASLVRVLKIALRTEVDEVRARYARLTARERQVFELVASGLRNKQIAHQLNISQITVQIHRGQVMRKMAARSIASLVRMADARQTGIPA